MTRIQNLDRALTAHDPRWWCRPGLEYVGETLMFAGVPFAELIARNGGSVLAYDGRRIRERIDALVTAFARTGSDAQVLYALKANRFGPLVDVIRGHGGCGIDACSPREVERALDAGFAPEEISFTGTSLSEADVASVIELPIKINVNSISAIHKIGRYGVGRPIGLRLNPRIGVGATASLTYAGALPTKFGIYPDRVAEAVRLAKSYGLEIEGVHMHIGSGWMADGLPRFQNALHQMLEIARPLGPLRYVNVGGGIGATHGPAQSAVDLDLYAGGVSEAVAEAFPGAQVMCEPGEFLVSDAGVLGATVTEVEEKGGALFAGLNIGFNSNPQGAHYGFAHGVLHATRAPSHPTQRSYCVSGNINEAIDLFNANATIPELHEGDMVAVLNAGAYGSSMASDHCLRERASEVVVRPA